MATRKPATPKRHFKHGWHPDLPDHRDFLYQSSAHYSEDLLAAGPLPAVVDLSKSPFMPAVEDQGQLGSCTAFGALGAYQYLRAMLGAKPLAPSHLFQYYVTRSLEGTVDSDAGASVRDAVKAIAQFGAARNALWPYNVAKYSAKPPAKAYSDAVTHQLLKYLRVTHSGSAGVQALRTCLAAGYPIVFGSTLYESFENPGPTAANHYVVPLPHGSEQILGGHCQLIVGYDQNLKAFKVRNSWGPSWALGGYEFFPYQYLDSGLASDFWTMRDAELTIKHQADVGASHVRDLNNG